MKNGTCFLKILDKQSVFVCNVVDPGRRQLAAWVVARLIVPCHKACVAGSTFHFDVLFDADGDAMLVDSVRAVCHDRATYQRPNKLSSPLKMFVKLFSPSDSCLCHKLCGKVELPLLTDPNVTEMQLLIAQHTNW
jgi:hypothetical protein